LKALPQTANVCGLVYSNCKIKTFIEIDNDLINRARDAKANIHFDHCPNKIVFRVDHIHSPKGLLGTSY